MIVVMEPDASEQAVESVISFLVNAGFDVHRSSGNTTTILGVVGDLSGNDVTVVSEFPGVSQVVRVSEQFRLASRRFRQQSTVIEGPWGSIGGDKPWIAIEAVGPSVSSASSGGGASATAGGANVAVGGASEPPPPSRELAYEVRAGRPFDAAVTRSPRAVDTIGALVCLSVHAQPSDQRFAVHFVERGPSWGANAWIGAAEKELARGDSSIVLLEAGGEYPNGARTLEIAAIARAKAGQGDPNTITARLVRLQAEGAPGLSDVVIRSYLIGMITGFVPTNTMAAGHMLEMLLRRPDFMAPTLAAARAGDDDRLKRCLFEAMRFWPLNPGPFRVCLADYTIAAGKGHGKTIKAAVRDFAKEAATRMETRIDDQLAEVNYRKVAKAAMFSGNLFGTGIVKGPLVEQRTRISYVWDEAAGRFEQSSSVFATPAISG